MYKLTILAVGGFRESFWKDAIDEYTKRLKPYAIVKVVEVAETPFKTASEAETVKRSEAERLRPRIGSEAYSIAMDERGRQMPSEDFAKLLLREGDVGREIMFVIGGTLGLDPILADQCHLKLSLSSMTFTHGEARAVLFEQIYRAMTILSRKSYHY